jgi:RimJ/RimL family protein N-acetyltransferase
VVSPGPTVHLREYRESDAEILVGLANNPRVSRYLTPLFPHPYSLADATWWVATGCKADGAVSRAIVVDGELTGGIGITPQEGWRSHQAEIGYWLAEPYWGRGIGTEAVRLMTAWAFESTQFLKLFAPVMHPNIASMKVLEKCGYVLEGVLKGEVFKHGAYFDLHSYACYRPQ